MAATWLKNEATASMRRCLLRVTNMATGQLADRALDFSGYVYITRDGVKSYVGLGTVVNHRRDLIVADDTFTAAATDICTAVAHGLETGDGPFRLTSSGTLPAGLSLATDYWIIEGADADTFKLATTLALAYAGTAVDITDAGTGTHTISDVVGSTERGIDGEWIYTATQAETNYSTAEMLVSLYGYADHESQTTVNIQGSGDGDTILEGSTTRDDARRIMLRYCAAPFNISSGVFTFRDLADTKDSFHGTISGSGRSSTAIDDPT